MWEDQAWQREAQTLSQIRSQLCGQKMKIHQNDKLTTGVQVVMKILLHVRYSCFLFLWNFTRDLLYLCQ